MPDTISLVVEVSKIENISEYIHADDVAEGYLTEAERLVWDKKADAFNVHASLALNGKETRHYVDWQDVLFNFITADAPTKDYYPNTVEFSNFFPMTCSCGHAGCAGIWDGVHVRYRKNTVEWVCPEKLGYKGLNNIYRFSRMEYEEVICKLMALYRDLHTRNVIVYEERGICGFQEKADPMAYWYGGFKSLADIEKALRARLKYVSPL